MSVFSPIGQQETQSRRVGGVLMLPSLGDARGGASWPTAVQGSEVQVVVAFVDLCNSARLYRLMGDSAALDAAMHAFDIVAHAVRGQNGSVVKIIGDALMAVFEKPAAALRATIRSQQAVDEAFRGQLALRTGMHLGGAISVNIDHRVDYFGTTVNFAARISRYSHAHEVVVSHRIYDDPDVQRSIRDRAGSISAERLVRGIKGFDGEVILWRLRATTAPYGRLSCY